MGYITVTCHFLTADWSLHSAVLSTTHVDQSHTAVHLSEVLKNITDQWNITSKVVCVTTDNALNITNAVCHNSWKNLPCFTHEINLVVTNSLSELTDLSRLIQSVKDIVSYFHRSTKASDNLKTIQARLNLPEHKLIQHVETRWNSVFYMLERYIEQDEAICTALCLLNRNDLLIDVDKLVTLQETVDTLRLFEAVTTEMSAEKHLSASKMIPITKAQIKVTTETTNNLALKLVDHMKVRFLNMEGNPILAAATILDPRFKTFAFADQGAAERSWTALVAQCGSQTQKTADSAIPVVEESDLLWRFFDQRVAEVRSTLLPSTDTFAEVQQFLRMPILCRKADPLQWWKRNEKAFANISKLATKYLSILATSVPSERLFTKAGELISAKRSRLKPKNVDMFLFLNKYED
uniref:HAT C-terminal dimerisation domain-containing protein n=1 Tax=Amphimedon queenslandica TaxID=400682 RepID=A0A1X7VSP8_AMPQE